MLALGDLTYADDRSQADVDRHFDDVMVWSRRAAYMPVWGNHEWGGKGATTCATTRAASRCPTPRRRRARPRPGCCGEDWYWFDHGAVRFIIYPEPYDKETWTDWARAAEPLFAAAQANPALRFIVTAGHRPAYSSGTHDGKPQLRAILDGFGERFRKYVLNLAGHSHDYERTKPQAHVVHVTAGIGGGPLEPAPTHVQVGRLQAPAVGRVPRHPPRLRQADRPRRRHRARGGLRGRVTRRGHHPLRRRRDHRPGADRRAQLTRRLALRPFSAWKPTAAATR